MPTKIGFTTEMQECINVRKLFVVNHINQLKEDFPFWQYGRLGAWIILLCGKLDMLDKILKYLKCIHELERI